MAIDTSPSIYPDNQYVASIGALADISSNTDIAIINGSASKGVYVTSVYLAGVATTSASQQVSLVKRSAANTGGTAAAMTAVPLDSNYSAATAAAQSYTGAAPSVGTPVGNVADAYIQLGSATVPTISATISFNPPVVLRGTAQGLAVNLNGASIAGGKWNVIFNWYEY